MKKTAVVICPGRGTYGANELGYLHKYHSNKLKMINCIDSFRSLTQQRGIWDLDGQEKFSISDHLKGENAASLIYGCSLGDYLDIDLEQFDIVAVTGNSMGWYIACACAGVFTEKNAIELINTMGSQMKGGLIGGQLIYPEVDSEWKISNEQVSLIEKLLTEVNLIEGHKAYTSINLGGLRVIGGNDLALRWLQKSLPVIQDIYPMKLSGNAAFHTPLLEGIAMKSRSELPETLFKTPTIPLIDGRGKIWMPYSTDVNQLWDYTLGEQICDVYDFTKSVDVAVKEFSPDHLILLGPGTNLGGAIAQVLIKSEYKNLTCKNDFKELQSINPYLLSMGELSQRSKVVNSNSILR